MFPTTLCPHPTRTDLSRVSGIPPSDQRRKTTYRSRSGGNLESLRVGSSIRHRVSRFSYHRKEGHSCRPGRLSKRGVEGLRHRLSELLRITRSPRCAKLPEHQLWRKTSGPMCELHLALTHRRTKVLHPYCSVYQATEVSG